MSREPLRSPTLAQDLHREIRARGPITFARFMERALYDPLHGYYASSGPGRLGARGDFVTASDVGRGFGRCLLRQLHEFDRVAGPFEPFDYVEFGAGRGLLARDVIDTALELEAPFAERLRCTLVDASASMRSAAARQVPEATVVAPDDLHGVRAGAVLAVELFDALPVHRLRRHGGQLVEVYVEAAAGQRLVEVEGPPTPEAAALARRFGVAAEDGDEAEVAPAAREWLDRLASTIDRGLILIVDYGDRAERLYRGGRSKGTLLAYHRHQAGRDYLERAGEQDLTAHVNFSMLEQRAAELGLSVLGLVTQDRFLVANGILESFETASHAEWRDPRRVKQRMQALQLIHPAAMGRAFKVLALSKACDPTPRLTGLRDPFALDERG